MSWSSLSTGGEPSALHRRLWFLEQLDADAGRYTTTYAVRLRGELDEVALDHAFSALLERHPELGSHCVDRDGEPVVVEAPDRPVLTRSSLEGRSPWNTLPDDERPFAAALATESTGDRLLVVRAHQSVAGPGVLPGLVTELGELYAGRVPRPAAEHGPAGPPARRWRESLDALQAHDIPADRPRPAIWRAQGATVGFAVPASFAGPDDAEFAVLAHTLLARHSGRWSGVLALARRGRTVPVPLDLPGDLPLGDALSRTRSLLADAGDVDVELVLADEAAASDMSRNPVFGVLVDVVDTVPQTFGNLAVEALPCRVTTTRYDLVLRFTRTPEGGWSGELEYPHSLLSRGAAERLAARAARLCASVADGGDSPIGRLELMPEAERAATLPAPPRRAVPTTTTHELVAEQARRSPDAVAVDGTDATLTYSELMARADAVTEHLCGLGVGVGDLVGVAVPRSAGLLCTLLGVLRTGAAYVPLDPDHPGQRLSHILDDAGVRVLLTTGDVRRDLPAVSGEIVELDEIAPASGTMASPTVTADDPAYVIYTSGSTGRPKGVQVGHGALANFLTSMSERPGVPDGVTFPAITTVSFDIAALELYLPLLRGGRVVVADRTQARDPERLAGLLTRVDARIMQATPVTWRLLLESGWRPPAGFVALCGGEKLPPELAARLCESGVRLWDLYGPTETTIWSSVAALSDGVVRDFAPVANTTLYVLDDRMEPVPLGGTGELYIGGAGVALGYLGRSALTAERFVPDPYGDGPGGRLYRTGDVARRHPDGRIEILGRTDHQVKIRGFRVEPGEIESVLAEHPLVRAAVVHLLTDDNGEATLVGYLRAAGGREPPSPELVRAHCSLRLPPYMVPARFVLLDEFPTTPNGKVDRAALPAPSAEPGPWPAEPDEPRTPTERVVSTVLAELLGNPALGPHDDFFALGGHSLLAIRAMNALRAELGVDAPLSTLFEARTVARLAARLAEATSAAPPLVPVPRTEPLPLSFAQRRLWFLAQLDPDSRQYSEPFSVRLTGPLDKARLDEALSLLLERHEILRTRYPSGADGDPVQVVDPPARTPVAAERGDPAEALSGMLATPFDLSAAPPVRIRVVSSSDDEHAVLFVVHHIATDDRSQEILADELEAAYRGRPLPPLPVQYGDYVVWQRDRLTEHAREDHLRFWRAQLTGVRPAEVPTDRPRPDVWDDDGGSVGFTVPPALAAGLADLGGRSGTTPFMAHLAVLFGLLGTATGQTDLAVGVPVAGRDHPGAENLIGCFVNTIVLRANLSGSPSFAELLSAVRDDAVRAYAHDELPFELLVEDLAPQRDPARNPLFQIMFTLHGARRADAVAMPGIGGAKLDLSWHLSERADGGLDGRIDYATALFDAETVGHLAERYVRMLGLVVDQCDRPVDDLPLLSTSELTALRRVATGPGAPADALLVQDLIAARAAERPGAVAVTGADRTLTYSELDREANRLARRLRELGAATGEYVGVLLPRTTDLVVALLAVLRSGAAYVPLDPQHPAERTTSALRDSGAALLVTHTDLAPRVPARLVPLDDSVERTAIARHPATPPSVRPGQDDLAYVVYTSGSTGRPKGVLVTHGGLANYLDWACRELSPGGTVPLHTSIAFDLVLTSVFPPLGAGATIALVESEQAGVDGLVAAGPQPFGLVKLTPTHLDLLGTTLSDVDQAGVSRCLVVAGEQLRGEQLAAWHRHAPDTVVVNSYGPSEVTIACCAEIARAGDVGPGAVPIGKPLPGVTCHVLDDTMRPVVWGAVGELYVGGRGVARGYLGQPARTAEAFVPDPFSAERGGRLYRTGDLVRLRGDGRLEFHGRRDQQVKIRGFRVEPGEVQSVLSTHPGVRAAAVVAAESAQGDRVLGAHVAPDGDGVDLADLRAFLAARLPEHLVPTLWSTVAELPLLRNGKLDHAALPTLAPAASDQPFAEPETPTEQAIADVWSAVLGVERVGVHDNFFDLGGQSLAATRVAARLKERLGLPVSVRDVFTGQTVTRLAATLDARTGTAAVARISPIPRTTALPLSFAQQRLWFLDQLVAGRSDYLVPTALRLRGELDVDALAGALSAVVARHEILRSRYLSGPDGQPELVIDPPAPVPLRVEHDDPRQVLADEAAGPIDLATGPMLRARLVRAGPDEHVLVLTIHHIATDGWSTGLLAAELDAAYRGAELPALPVGYVDHSAWQRERMSGEHLAERLTFWREQLADLEPTELPTDRPRPRVHDPRGALRRFRVAPDTARALDELGHRHRATTFTTLLAAFFAVVSRYTGRTDVAVGTPVAGRAAPESEDLVGLFVNTVVQRADLSGDPAFGDLLDRVRARTVDVMAHDDLPFELLVEDLAPERDLSRNPLFQLLFAYRDEGEDRFHLPGLEVTPEPVPSRTSKFDVTVELTRAPDGGLDGVVEYATALFDSATIDRLVTHFLHLLDHAAASPGTPVSRLALLDDTEAAALLRTGTGPVRSRGEHQLPELIAQRARHTPDAVAVRDELGHLTYGDLLTRADALARTLRATGIGRDDVVGVCLPRRPDLVVAILGVQRAGAAVLPLDPAHPAERHRWMLEDSGARLVIADPDTTPPGTAVLTPDSVGAAESGPEPVRADPDSLAYVVYTSGSTGRPKGVGVAHRGIRNRVLWAVETFGISPADRMLQKTVITFDAAMWEVLAPLVSGGTVVLAPSGVEHDPAAMVRTVAEHEVTILQAVPSLWRPLADEPGLGDRSSLRLLFSAGEPLTTELADRLPAQLVNTYGPTECSIDVTAWPHAEGGPGSDSGSVPIGRPLDNTRIHVLDPDGGLAPTGVAGELFAAGDGLARGYLGRPRRTAEAFVPDPYGPPGSRMYRTGDIVRRDADGVLHFLGRDDDQVKIRGIRIEPREIETVLSEHPGVAAAAVVPRPGPEGRLQLVAYVLPRTASLPDSDLRDHLLATLPAPYVPSIFVLLDRLPLTSSGKTDRAALPSPDESRLGHRLVPPTTTEEKLVASVWREVLDLNAVGITEDFFTLGGHSLLAGRVTSRLRAASGVELPVRAVFEDRTVAGLAARLTRYRDSLEADTPPLAAELRVDEPPLSFAQQRLWFLDQLNPGGTEYHVTWALRLAGRLDVAALSSAVSDLLARHETLRTRYPKGKHGDPFQLVEPAAPVNLTPVELGPEESAEGRLGALSRTPFALAERPPVTPILLRTGTDEHVFALVLHHIASDGWSEEILARELSELYSARLDGRAPTLVPAPLQYADYASWQRNRIDGELLDDQLEHWRRRLSGLPRLDLPTDRLRMPSADGEGAVVRFRLPAEVCRTLVALGRRRGATPFMTFLAVFACLLHRNTGAVDVPVGTPVAGRGRSELENVVGFFVNTVVVRADLGDNPSFDELVDRVRDAALDAFGHDELPFDLLVEELAPQRDLARTPLFDVMFEVREAPEDTPRLRDLDVRRVTTATTTAKFDLTMALTAEPDGGYSADVEYATALFDESTMERLTGHFAELARSAARSPDAPIGQLTLLTAAERRLLVHDWNEPGSETGPECLHDAFDAQVDHCPSAVAVDGPGGPLTYTELSARADELATRLRAVGAGAERPVAVLLERSSAAVIALLAVLKSGSAYVPLDPAHPPERIAFMLDELAPAAVIAEPATPALAGVEHPVLSVAGGGRDPIADDAPAPVHPDQLAYLIYTSGSSGRPKAVMVPHRAYTQHCRVIADTYDIRAGDRVLLLAALTFDVAMDQIAATLLAGATVVIGESVFWTPAELPDRLAENRVTHMEITPAYYREMMAGVGEADARLAGLRLMNVGSDVVTHDDARRWLDTALPGRFLCTYGPTEATITSVVHPVTREAAAEGAPDGPLPIGRPVPGTRAYVLDEAMNPVPVGVPGELYLGGHRLSRGYLGRAGLTADRFVPDPLGERPGQRLYRTGDLVRYRSGGDLEFLGRIDTQVKVRGFRIELGEVEAALAQHPGVQAVAVATHGEPGGERALVGYVVPADGRTCSPSELRAFLRGRLPDYMVPALWVTLDTLPLTASKKIDRKALPAPDLRQAALDREHVEPRGEIEAAIADIWADVLAVPRVSVHDDFFEIGGHSLLATRVMTRLEDLFAIDVPLRVLFEATSVAAQAEALERLAETEAEHETNSNQHRPMQVNDR
ncbi:non-ribosomal peptide synthetase [Prauserella cavernicola]|uniref:Amino acid adenylation domain-containing protein n=1 Tax=Prauserella cavernicola TaxID=2800127 RepID=A0A934V833_9PSEU|nr:non-ribosomal peptide synthetase [Prauserella cavernicola]MBK1787885.1 amino acid adenylation domain-containing protein [Prauserella cavernicola]